MSKHGLAKAMDSWELAETERVYANTWGHLAPKKGKTYPCTIVFCQTCHGQYTVIDTNGIPSSPWMFSAVNGFAADFAENAGEILKFVGIFRNYKFTGEITTVKA